MREVFERDLEMLELLSVATKEAVRKKYGMSLGTFDAWLHRIRHRRRDARIYVNRILSLENRNPHLKKILLPTTSNEELITDVKELG